MTHTEHCRRAGSRSTAKKAAAVAKNGRQPVKPGSKPRGQHGHASWILKHGGKP